MSKLPKDFWIRPLSIGIALSVPSVVVAATVSFREGAVLDVATMTALSQRTLDKDRVYVARGAVDATGDGEAGVSTASCEANEDVLLNCTCSPSTGSTQAVVHAIRVAGADNPNTASSCQCDAVSSGAVGILATAVCIDLPPLQ